MEVGEGLWMERWVVGDGLGEAGIGETFFSSILCLVSGVLMEVGGACVCSGRQWVEGVGRWGVDDCSKRWWLGAW